ncbi:hypothetical protein CORC01_05029 [Colletotrichum orchidophilum]|uniref:Uncharacterized protein n=1 Tax=Colletotrichum orchidophilum TaxID=1209926 RepID=A0A1G4BE45_9PEZI|nr:uncharacterized protein CORC01_05029 [Colletotrichum orchidophilum]OHE99671.1 hypothetical protein CORC01_05029 [Colletotrichum orchidophilum]
MGDRAALQILGDMVASVHGLGIKPLSDPSSSKSQLWTIEEEVDDEGLPGGVYAGPGSTSRSLQLTMIDGMELL